MLTRRVGTLLDRALRRFALRALEEELHLLAPAELAIRSEVPSHQTLRRFGGRQPFVRHRRHVLDGTDLKTNRLQGTNRGLPARPRPLDEHVDLAHPVLLGAAGRGLRGHLRGERRGLPRTLEPHLTGAGPGDHRAAGIGDRDDGVVERALDVRVAVRHVLLLLPAHLLSTGLASRLRWHRAGVSPVLVGLVVVS